MSVFKKNCCVLPLLNAKSIFPIVLMICFVFSKLSAATYYTKANGNWNSSSTWGSSCGVGTGDIPASGDDVIICNGYTVNLIGKASCSKITVDSSAIFIVNSNDTLTISSNIIVDGTMNLTSGIINSTYSFTINGILNMTSGKLNLTENASNCNLNINGVFNFSGGEVAVAHFTHVQNGGIFSISDSAIFTAERDVKLRDTKGSINLTGGTALFKGELNSANAADEFNQTGGLVQFEGDNSWFNAGTFNSTGGEVFFNGNTTLNYVPTDGFWNFFKVTIGTNKSLNQFDAINVNIKGDWVNNGSFTHKNRQVSICGDSTQKITGTSPTTFYTLSINNSSSTGVTILQPTRIANELKLIDGFLYTDSINLIIVENNAGSNAGSRQSFVSGPMKKIGNDPFVFPLGNAEEPIVWARLEMVDDTNFRFFNASTEFTCTYFNTPAPNNSPEYLEASINHVSKVEFWDLERTFDVANNAKCNVRVYWDDSAYSGITDTSHLVLAHYNSEFSYYEKLKGVSEGSKSGSIITKTPLTTFSPITFGSTLGGNINPLPITLIEFEATAFGKSVLLNWKTATEINNDFFILEKSQNGVKFETVSLINGSGNSNALLNYSFEDSSPFEGISYYRLKQTDFDGETSYSKIKAVQMEVLPDLSFSVLQNPNSNGTFHLLINSIKNNHLIIAIHNFKGELLFYKSVIISTPITAFLINDLNPNSGFYIISLLTETNERVSKTVQIN